ncbi:hypothetical protein Fleli_3998 [Bernardetia litoralis DSM 6794]|uniref:Uncharacterized protein n=1 Tax=Bernardetia litoralis (strain ATCC 23117 / DSM 6794 / NBRC 15988 / NCIMB 1366 / Fx l1 / Sio-4) TaxID=880071 RepID=I4AQR5_BERLS|nr:hypothetical protein [Bernardetia litoralis]AFM06300.1 hypothetical protein Fleli_3998 [Bernardetia litoralis DSM 6794]
MNNSKSKKDNIQLYSYVGSQEIFDSVDINFVGYKISKSKDILNWIEKTAQELINNSIIATFIINENHQLVINDRHSEHVQCAGGKNVISAGEISFLIEKKDKISINEISNQSTGYCPKPESWKYVEKVLSKIEIEYPNYFTLAFDFRLCTNCQTINLIKEQVFECQMCETELDLKWNFH